MSSRDDGYCCFGAFGNENYLSRKSICHRKLLFYVPPMLFQRNISEFSSEVKISNKLGTHGLQFALLEGKPLLNLLLLTTRRKPYINYSSLCTQH